MCLDHYPTYENCVWIIIPHMKIGQGESVATKLRKVAKVSENFTKHAKHLVKFQKFGEVASKMYNNIKHMRLLYEQEIQHYCMLIFFHLIFVKISN